MMLRRYMFREVRRRPGRTVLTLVGIVIGVQALVAIPVSIETTRYAHRDLFEGLTGKAALEVVSLGQGGFAPGLAAEFERVQGVGAAVPVIQSSAAILGRSALVPVMTLLSTSMGPALTSKKKPAPMLLVRMHWVTRLRSQRWSSQIPKALFPWERCRRRTQSWALWIFTPADSY